MGRKARNKLGATGAVCPRRRVPRRRRGSLGTASAASPVSFTYWTSAWTAQRDHHNRQRSSTPPTPATRPTARYIAKSDEFLPKVIAAVKSNTHPTVLVDQNPRTCPFSSRAASSSLSTDDLPPHQRAFTPGIKKSLFYRGQQLGMALASMATSPFLQQGRLRRRPASSPRPARGPSSRLTPSSSRSRRPSAGASTCPTGDAEWISYDWEPVLWGDGGSLLNANQTKATFDSPAGVQALTTWVNLVRGEGGARPPATQPAAATTAAIAFVSNAVAMITDGPWLELRHPQELRLRRRPLPGRDHGPSTNIGILVAALFKTTTAQDAAGLAFIKFLSSPKEAAYIASQDYGEPDSPGPAQPARSEGDRGQAPGYGVFSDMVHIRRRPASHARVGRHFDRPVHRDQRRHRREVSRRRRPLTTAAKEADGSSQEQLLSPSPPGAGSGPPAPAGRAPSGRARLDPPPDKQRPRP